jgi:hypothetical protein
MKESYRKGPANHPGPESCEGSAKRKGALEALTGVYAGFVLSSEIDHFRVPTRSDGLEGNTTAGATASPLKTLRSRRPEQHRTFMGENREALFVARAAAGWRAGWRRR